jgi:hypothetical protein
MVFLSFAAAFFSPARFSPPLPSHPSFSACVIHTEKPLTRNLGRSGPYQEMDPPRALPPDDGLRVAALAAPFLAAATTSCE